MDIMRQSTRLVVNPVTVYSYGFLLNWTTMGQTSDSMTVLTQSFSPLVGLWCLSLAEPDVAQLWVFFSSDHPLVIEPFLLVSP